MANGLAIGEGWDPAWDRINQPKIRMVRPFKGHAYERSWMDRVAKVEKNMAEMPERVAEYRARRKALKNKDSFMVTIMKEVAFPNKKGKK